VTSQEGFSVAGGAASFVLLIGLWFIYPFISRRRRATHHSI